MQMKRLLFFGGFLFQSIMAGGLSGDRVCDMQNQVIQLGLKDKQLSEKRKNYKIIKKSKKDLIELADGWFGLLCQITTLKNKIGDDERHSPKEELDPLQKKLENLLENSFREMGLVGTYISSLGQGLELLRDEGEEEELDGSSDQSYSYFWPDDPFSFDQKSEEEDC